MQLHMSVTVCVDTTIAEAHSTFANQQLPSAVATLGDTRVVLTVVPDSPGTAHNDVHETDHTQVVVSIGSERPSETVVPSESVVPATSPPGPSQSEQDAYVLGGYAGI